MNIDLSTKEEINLRLHQLGAYFAIKLRDEPTSANRELYEIVNALLDKFNTLQPQWIPVSEKLPEDGDEVLLSYDIHWVNREKKGISEDIVIAIYDSENDEWLTVAENAEIISYPRAWMPLPDPYLTDV